MIVILSIVINIAFDIIERIGDFVFSYIDDRINEKQIVINTKINTGVL